jgi:hypothetical protein
MRPVLLVLYCLQHVGIIHFTVQFMPFQDPIFDDDIELKPVKSGALCLRAHSSVRKCRIHCKKMTV